MSLIHWWPLNGDTQDRISGVALTNNNATTAIGKVGQCYQFNGSANLTTSLINSLSLTPTHFSFSLWLKLDNAWNDWGQILTLGNPGASWTDIRIGFDVANDKRAYFTISDGTNSTNYSGPQYSLDVNTWYHVTCTFDNKLMRLFINGNLQMEYNVDFLPILPNDLKIFIGGNGGENGECYINDVRIYDHVLSKAEIQELSKALVLHYMFTQPLGYNGLIKDNSNAWQTAFASSGAGVTAGTATYDQIDNSVCCTNNNANIRFQYLTLIPAVAGEMFEAVVKYKHISGDKRFCFQIEEINSNYRATQVPWWSHAGSSPNVTKEMLQEYPLDDDWVLMKYSFTVTNPETTQLQIWLQSGPDYVSVNNSFYLKDFQLYKLENMITDESGLGHDATLNNPEYYRFVHDSVRNKTALHSLGGEGINPFINTSLNPCFITNGTICFWYQKDESAMDWNNGNFLIMTPDRTRESGWLGATSRGSAPTNNSNCHWHNWYYDGILQNESNEQDTKWHFYCATDVDISNWTTLQIHSHGDDNWKYRGKIADFRIYNSVLSPEDVKDLYSCGGRISNLGDAFTGEFIEGSASAKINKNHTIQMNEFIENDEGKASIKKGNILSSRQIIEI